MAELIEINLLPIEDRKVEKDYTYLLDARVVLPTLGVILTLLVLFLGKSFMKNELDRLVEKKASLERDIRKNQSILKDIKKLEQLLREKNAKNNSLKSINLNKQLWVRILEGVSKTLPPNSWITDIKQEDGLSLNGATHLFSEVALYMIALEEDKFFQKVHLNKIEVSTAQKKDVFSFALKIKLNLDPKTGKPPPSSPPPPKMVAKL